MNTISSLTRNHGHHIRGPIRWNQELPDQNPGVYFVCVTNEADKDASWKRPLIDMDVVKNWLSRVPRLKLDGNRPTTEKLSSRISQFWLPDESILYIGSTTRPLKTRVGELYIHQIGDAGPHKGGHWLKTLRNLKDVSVFWCETKDVEAKDLENKFLDIFMKNVSMKTTNMLFDPKLPLPFGNIEININGKRSRKRHGISRSIYKNIKSHAV